MPNAGVTLQPKEYEFDVAFSFLAQDELLATELNSLLGGRLKTFLYSKKQEIVAGTDGEATFNRVFGQDARAAVILHRPEWGSTPFTRFEETAIRNRAFDEGYDFCLFIPLGTPQLPKWVPKNRIWIGLDRWEAVGAASVIEARVQELGGAVRVETAKDRALRLKRDIQAEQDRQTFLGSQFGLEASNVAFADLVQSLQATTDGLREDDGFDISLESKDGSLALRSHGYSITLAWVTRYRNTLSESRMILIVWKGPVSLFGHRFAGRTEEISSVELDFNVNRAGQHGWTERSGGQRFFTSEAMAEHLLKRLLELIRKDELR